MSPENTPITTESKEHDGTHVTALSGSLCDDGIATARKALSQAIEGGASRLALEMSAVDYVSSSGIGMLVSVLKKCHQANVEFALCNLNQDIHELFTLTRLDQVFTLAQDVETWQKSLA